MIDVTMSAATPTIDDFEVHRSALTGYCYRMLGSASEAEDAVQETMLRAWRGAESFAGRSSVRSGCSASPPTSAPKWAAAPSAGLARSTLV
jgi:DNA-directed RNA polymerase specialized sigma24 family protein